MTTKIRIGNNLLNNVKHMFNIYPLHHHLVMIVNI